jgi:uncharacterized protein YndB with AHSA1/START domain
VTTIEPVVATVTVPCDQARAFELFTAGISRWWPVAGHSVGEDEVATVVCEPGLDGRVFERWHDGREHEWGRITAWSPPDRLAFTWSPSPSDDVETNVEVTFGAVDGGTLVRLTHAGWEALGEAGGEKRTAYDAGWPHVLTRLLDATLGPVAHRAFARSANGETWRHLESGEAADAVMAAHASAYHWRAVGGVVERARADWLCSRAHAAAGDAAAALRHAEASLAACEDHPDDVADFDHAYAAEAMARALALAGEHGDAATWRTKAEDLGAAIADPQDREIFDGDLAAP